MKYLLLILVLLNVGCASNHVRFSYSPDLSDKIQIICPNSKVYIDDFGVDKIVVNGDECYLVYGEQNVN